MSTEMKILPRYTIEPAEEGGFTVCSAPNYREPPTTAFAGSLGDCLAFLQMKLGGFHQPPPAPAIQPIPGMFYPPGTTVTGPAGDPPGYFGCPGAAQLRDPLD